MRFLIIGDFGGSVPGSLEKSLQKEHYDAVLCQGDLSNIKRIGEIFKKHGPKFREILGEEELDKIRTEGLLDAKKPLQLLNGLGKPVYLVLGNNEYMKREGYRKLVGQYSNLHLLDSRSVQIGGITVAGYPFVFREDQEDLEELVNNFSMNVGSFDSRNTILLTPIPPYNCDLDKIPETNDYNAGKHVGSKVVSKLIEKYQFPLVVCGHLEEYQGECLKDGARVINPGAGDQGKYAILEVEPSNLDSSEVSFRSSSA